MAAARAVVMAAIVVSLAYFPPAWIRERLGVDPLDPGAAGPAAGEPPGSSR
jgi:hypothetical protein